LTLTLRPYGAVGLLEPSPGNHAAAARVGVAGPTAEFVRDAMNIYAERNLTG